MSVYFPPSLIAGWVPSSIKPRQLTATFVVKATCRLKPGAAAEVVEDSDEADAPQPEPFSGDRYIDDDLTKALLYANDFAPFKPRADVLVLAAAHAPGGKPVRQMRAAIHVGALSKVLTVYGKRTWQPGLIGRAAAGEAEMFVTLPIAYEYALGGPGDKKNLIGTGKSGDLVPQIEDPRFPIRSTRDAHDPAGFGPLSPAWLPRAGMLGTYRGNWVKERWPWLPTDFDYGYFNAAPRDQQIQGYLRGNEELRFENLHPSHPDYRCRLPALRVRCFALIRGIKGEEQFREVPLNLDTLWIDTTQEKMVLIWRGLTEVRTPKMKEIEHVLVWAEPIAEPPKSIAYYRQFLETHLHPPDEDEPGEPEVPAEDWEPAFDREMAEMHAEIALAEEKLLAQAAAEKANMIAAGADPKLFDPQPPVPASVALAPLLEHNPDLTTEQMARQRKAVGEAIEAEAKLAGMDAEFAKDFPEPATREEVLAEAAQTRNLAGRDLSEMDLSGLDWTGIDLSGCDLGKSNLSGTKLAGANLTGAILTEANLTGVDLTRANLDDADFDKSILAEAVFALTSLNGTMLSGLALAGLDFSGSKGRQTDFAGADLSKASLIGVDFYAPSFDGCNLEGAACIGARLERADFDGAKAAGINLEGAQLPRMNADAGTDFSRGNFKSAVAPKASFEGANLDHANFSRASLPGGQFGDANLRDANLDRADLTGAVFDDAILAGAKLTHVNLLRANLERADLTGADLTGANLFEAGLWEVRIQDTKLGSANLKRTLLES